jgi:hypothetical protein
MEAILVGYGGRLGIIKVAIKTEPKLRFFIVTRLA